VETSRFFLFLPPHTVPALVINFARASLIYLNKGNFSERDLCANGPGIFMEKKSLEEIEEERRLYICDLLGNVFRDFEPVPEEEKDDQCSTNTSEFLLSLVRSHYGEGICDGVFLYTYLTGRGYKNVLSETGNYYYWLIRRRTP